MASCGRFTVLLMAPEMNGWTAAIMRTWPMGSMKRVPRGPQRLAQSNTGRCSALRPGAPSTVRLPHTTALASSICASVKPR